MLNIDDPQWRSPIQQFQVSGVSYLVLLDTDHEVADSFIGNVPKTALHDQVAKLLGKISLS
ncbi:MAG: hypothetical protein F6K30_11965 [Cyanothece sp. SIO2G6]|nr:hypothetical protein [Cyanothece sp. SIO2G6]